MTHILYKPSQKWKEPHSPVITFGLIPSGLFHAQIWCDPLCLYIRIKAKTSMTFILLSFVTPVVITDSCRSVFGPHYPSFMDCSCQSFLVCDMVCAALTGGLKRKFLYQRPDCALHVTLAGETPAPWYCKIKSSSSSGPYTQSPSHSAIDSDFIDIYLYSLR